MKIYSNQFLISNTLIKSEINNFVSVDLIGLHIYHSDECNILHFEKGSNPAVLMLGFIIDYESPNKKQIDILEDISKGVSNGDYLEYINKLSGRFLLVIKDDGYKFIGDACGLKSLYYTGDSNAFLMGSSVSIIENETNKKDSERELYYLKSNYVSKNIEHWIPSGISINREIFSLTPNHLLNTNKMEQVRFWPNKERVDVDYVDAKEKVKSIIKESIRVAGSRYKLSFPITAGWDARLLLSLSKEISNDMFIYTLKYRDLDDLSADIKVPRELLKDVDLKHHVIDCNIPQDQAFEALYRKNTNPSHYNDWGVIAHGIYKSKIKGMVCLKGNCSEIARCYYYSDGIKKEVSDYTQIIALEKGWAGVEFIEARVQEWFLETKPICDKYGYDILDLFYWEHRMGSWQSSSQLEWDVSQEAFTPYNNRELMGIMLSIESKFRSEPQYKLYHDIIDESWPELLKHPINPRTLKQILKSAIKKKLILKIKSFLGR